MELYDAIFYRKTVKNYSNKNISKHLMEQVKEICSDITYLNKELNIKAHVIERGHLVHFLMDKKNRVKAPHYIVVTSNEGEDYLQNIGFAIEKVVLQLTSLGLATCWLDCNLEMRHIEEFNHVENYENEYGKLIDLEKNKIDNEDEETQEDKVDEEKPHIIIAFGYPEREEALFKSIEKEANRKKITQISKKMDKKWSNVLNVVRLAPSINNTQPWMFYYKNNTINVYQEKQKKVLNKMSKVSMGIALCHFDIGCMQERIDVEYKKLSAKKKIGKEYYISII